VLRRSGVNVKPTIAEQQLLELLRKRKSASRSVAVLPKSDYEELITAPIFTALVEIEAQGGEPDLDSLLEKTEGDIEMQQLLPMLLMGGVRPEDEKDADTRLSFQKCMDALRLVNIDRRIRELSAEIAIAEREGNDARRVELITEYGACDRLRKSFEPQSQIARIENR
jgi:hypothetical protein